MATTPIRDDRLAEEFSHHRAHLVAVAYRLTGAISDAEDAVQEAWLRLSGRTQAQRADIRDLRGWLTTVVSRICLDRLRSATARRERYVGQWLPEPIVTTPSGFGEDPLEAAVRDDGLRMAAMVVLDKLTPEQRVAFVLHDAFSVPFPEIAEIMGTTVDAARQHGSRGRRLAAEADPPPRVAMDKQQPVLERFLSAVFAGDVRAVAEVLHPDVVLIGDGGGKARTSRQIMVGPDKIVRFFEGLRRLYRPGTFETAQPVLVNGDAGVYLPPAPGGEGYHGVDTHITTIAIRDGKIVTIYDQANPDKLRHLP